MHELELEGVQLALLGALVLLRNLLQVFALALGKIVFDGVLALRSGGKLLIPLAGAPIFAALRSDHIVIL